MRKCNHCERTGIPLNRVKGESSSAYGGALICSLCDECLKKSSGWTILAEYCTICGADFKNTHAGKALFNPIHGDTPFCDVCVGGLPTVAEAAEAAEAIRVLPVLVDGKHSIRNMKPFFVAQFQRWEYSAEQYSDWTDLKTGKLKDCRKSIRNFKKLKIRSKLRILRVQIVKGSIE